MDKDPSRHFWKQESGSKTKNNVAHEWHTNFEDVGMKATLANAWGGRM